MMCLKKGQELPAIGWGSIFEASGNEPILLPTIKSEMLLGWFYCKTFSSLFFLYKILHGGIYSYCNSSQGKNYRKNRFGVYPFVKIVATKTKYKNYGPHLKCHIRISCKIVKLLLVVLV